MLLLLLIERNVKSNKRSLQFDCFCRDLEGKWLHHPHFSVDLHLAGLQTLWSKMSNLVVMVMRILVHFPWHPLHHLPQQEAVLGWSLVTPQLQWGLKVLIALAGIGATAAFLLLLNSILNHEKEKKRGLKNHQSSKSRGDFWDWGANLNFNLIVLYLYVYTVVHELIKVSCIIERRWEFYILSFILFEE